MTQTVLVADGDDESREKIARTLRGHHYRVMAVSTGTQAMAALLVCPICLLVADSRLRDLDLLLARMSDDPKIRRTPLLLLADIPDFQYLHLATIRKPFQPDKLAELVTAMIGAAQPGT